MKRAFALTEVLIVLGIISTVMVTSVTVLVSGLATVRKNEVADATNLETVKILELLKSPNEIVVYGTTMSQNNVDYSFMYMQNPTGNAKKILVHNVNNQPITSCSSSSQYKLTDYSTDNLESQDNLTLCMQIIIRPVVSARTQSKLYQITINKVQQYLGETSISSVRAVRYSLLRTEANIPGSNDGGGDGTVEPDPTTTSGDATF